MNQLTGIAGGASVDLAKKSVDDASCDRDYRYGQRRECRTEAATDHAAVESGDVQIGANDHASVCRGLVQRGGEGIASGHDGRGRMGCLDQSGCSYSLIRSRRAGSNDAPRQRAFPQGGQIPALPVSVPVIGPFEAEVDDVLVALGL